MVFSSGLAKKIVPATLSAQIVSRSELRRDGSQCTVFEIEVVDEQGYRTSVQRRYREFRILAQQLGLLDAMPPRSEIRRRCLGTLFMDQRQEQLARVLDRALKVDRKSSVGSGYVRWFLQVSVASCGHTSKVRQSPRRKRVCSRRSLDSVDVMNSIAESVDEENYSFDSSMISDSSSGGHDSCA